MKLIKTILFAPFYMLILFINGSKKTNSKELTYKCETFIRWYEK